MTGPLARALLGLVVIACLGGCKAREMSAECKAILEQPPPSLMALHSSARQDDEGGQVWTVEKSNPAHLPMVLDVSHDTSGLATAGLARIAPGGREVVMSGRMTHAATSLEIAVPRMTFTRSMATVGKARSSVSLLFPVDPALATLSQTPRDGAGFRRGRSHTAGLGGQHEAVDIDAPLGTPIVAPADGVVAHAYDSSPDTPCDFMSHSGYSNYVILVTDDDVSLLLGHLRQASVLVKPGARVRRGDAIAQVGHSGSGDRSHIHLVAMAVGPEVVDSVPIRFAACGSAAEEWEPRNGPACR